MKASSLSGMMVLGKDTGVINTIRYEQNVTLEFNLNFVTETFFIIMHICYLQALSQRFYTIKHYRIKLNSPHWSTSSESF